MVANTNPQINQRVVDSRKQLHELSHEVIGQLTAMLLAELGKPDTHAEAEGLAAFQNRDYDTAKRCCLCDPCSPYLAAISCMASAFRSPMVADSVLRDAARHTTEVSKRRCEQRIAAQFAQILSLDLPES